MASPDTIAAASPADAAPAPSRPRRIFIAVAEVSGDNHAAQLIRELKLLDPTLLIEGLGGPAMAAAGAVIHRNTVTKAAMGWRGILRAGEVYRLLRWTDRYFENHRPDLLIGVDSPSMNFHFARIASDRGIPTLQYVAPQLWAWAIWRMKKVRKWVQTVACILPFEEDFFRGHGVNAIFVGHPLFDQLPPAPAVAAEDRFPARPPVVGLLAGSRKSEAEANFPGMLATAERIAREFPDVQFLAPTTPATDPIVRKLIAARQGGGTHAPQSPCAMTRISPSPGTPGEGWGGGMERLESHDSKQLAKSPPPCPPPEYRERVSQDTAPPGARSISAQERKNPPDAGSEVLRRAGFPAIESGSSASPETGIVGNPPSHEDGSKPQRSEGPAALRIDVAQGGFDDMVRRCDLCITVSGTATLHVAALGAPMIVVYAVGWASWNLAGRWLVPTRTFALVNVLATRGGFGGHIVPEFVPWDGAGPVPDLALDMLRHPEKLDAQRSDLARLVGTLNKPGASRNTAELALKIIERAAANGAPDRFGCKQ